MVSLISYSNLLHVRRIVPEQPFFNHHTILLMPYGAHVDRELLACLPAGRGELH
jgi:hypothetical protein